MNEPSPPGSLEDEIAAGPWIYPWRLRDGRELLVPTEDLASVHRTRAELIETRVRTQLSEAPDATALDLACNEGWFSHRLLEWGASRVVGIDVRARNIHRAQLLREHFAIPNERLDLRQGDLFDIDPANLGRFDVVLLLGLLYHVENPMGALRLARACTRGVCVIETQLTRQVEPIVHGYGRTGEMHAADGSLAIVVEKGDNPLASTGRVLSFVPNRAALEQMMRAAGFEQTEFAQPRADHNAQYVDGDRVVVFAT